MNTNNLEFVFDVNQSNHLMQPPPNNHAFCPLIAPNNVLPVHNHGNKPTIINVTDVFDINVKEEQSSSSEDTQDFETRIKEEAMTDDTEDSEQGEIVRLSGKKRKRGRPRGSNTFCNDREIMQFESPRKKRKMTVSEMNASMTNKELDGYIIKSVSNKQCMFKRWSSNHSKRKEKC